jgi:hypothetical protein
MVMNNSRRNVLLTSLFGAGAIGLRALATGLPVSFLLNPRRALANGPCPTGASPQFVILLTSGNGDPINANCPGSYGVANLYNCPALMKTNITLGGKSYAAAQPWAMANLDGTRTAVFHCMTNTPVHPKEPDVLGLMSAISPADMFPSFLARNLQACLGTIQAQPISVGASTPSEALTYSGAALPTIPPVALKATLVNPTGVLTKLQPLRDDTLNKLADLYKGGATPAQAQFIDSMVTSQSQVRNISQTLLQSLSDLKDNTADSQIIAAVALIQMKITPVVAIHIPFGGDNHHDAALATEAAEHTSGFATLDTLLGNLKSAGLADNVSIVSLNVFGRTLGPNSTDGRQHNPNHQVSFAIGKPFKGGVYGGVGPVAGDFGATVMSSKTGAGGPGGDIQPVDTLAAFGMTVAQGVGVDPMIVSQQINSKYNPSGMGSAKVITAALG